MATSEERESGPVPAPIDDQDGMTDLVFEVLLDRVQDVDRFGDPSDPVGDALMTLPPDFQQLEEELDWIGP